MLGTFDLTNCFYLLLFSPSVLNIQNCFVFFGDIFICMVKVFILLILRVKV